MRARRRGPKVHLGCEHCLGHLLAVGGGDACGAHQVGAGLRKHHRQVEVIGTWAQQGCLDLVVDLRRLDDSEWKHRLPVEGATVGDQERGFVVHPAVEVDTTRVVQAAEKERARHSVWVGKRRGVLHAANCADGKLLAHQPLVRREVDSAQRARLIDQLTHDVRQ